jgi:3-hydroxybutyryl-CoA dehydrogenase
MAEDMSMKIEELKTVLVLGAGTMGSRISLGCALHGYDVVVYDVSEDALKGMEFRHQMMGHMWAEEGQTTQEEVEEAVGRIRVSADAAEAAADADLLIEAVPERLALKHEVYRQFEKLCPERTVFVSNTSSLLVSEMEASVKRKDRFAALHFHGYKSVVDIMRGTQTSDETVELLRAFSRRIGELPIVMKKENIGFLHNYMFIALLEAAMWLGAGGFGSIEDIDRSWMKVHDARMGPFGMLDMVGIDVAVDVGQGMLDRGHDGHWEEIREFLNTYIEQGHLGVKTGKGFYTYPDPAYAQPEFLEGE